MADHFLTGPDGPPSECALRIADALGTALWTIAEQEPLPFLDAMAGCVEMLAFTIAVYAREEERTPAELQDILKNFHEALALRVPALLTHLRSDAPPDASS